MENKISYIKNSSSYFKNTGCEYYPCHFAGQNCLFCYCPLYGEACGGHYDKIKFMKGIKDCSNCSLPHLWQNYNVVIIKLKGKEIDWQQMFAPAKKRKRKRL